MEVRAFPLWIVFRRAQDLPGQWTAHCLDLDVITVGTSLRHAIEMAEEACYMVLADDLNAGRDPLTRRAPDEHWSVRDAVVDHGKRVDDLEVLVAEEPATLGALVITMTCLLTRRAEVPTSEYAIPFAWQDGTPQPVAA